MFRFWADALRRKFDVMKVAASFFGIKMDDPTKAAKTPEDAATVLDNPLSKFPNDVDYFTKAEVAEKLCYVGLVKKRKSNIRSRGLWTQERADACLGREPVSKRASMNDLLWEKYSELKSNGVTMTLDRLKYMLEIDIARSKLYPNITEMTERNQYERRHKLSQSVLNITDPPPDWFVAKMQKSGELRGCIAELRRLANGRTAR